ncbi:ribonuclease HII [Candidatus Berkelbacteria bacterium]|nr:ribonuclease HII [Candidatus Berkelbacteria bacterium]
MAKCKRGSVKRANQPIPQEELEGRFRAAGHKLICGIDEVGRGAWAGPLVIGAVILPPDRRILTLRDSKLLRRDERELLARRIKRVALAWAIGIVEVTEMNQIGLGQSLMLAAERAVASLRIAPTQILIDGRYPWKGLAIPQHAIVRGDQTVRVIAAASVIAKVERDRMLRTLHRTDKLVRRYRFDLNKGYPSPFHQAQLRELGPSVHHRLSFRPIRENKTLSMF